LVGKIIPSKTLKPKGKKFWSNRDTQGVAEGESRGGIDLEVTELPDENQILITATSHGKTLGRVYFDIFDSQLVAADAEVASEYHGQGIAAIIYDYAKELGWEVVRSGRQTDAGAGFWDKHRPKQDVWEQGVAEGIETINGSKYSVDPDKYYVWAWDGAAVLYGEYDNINDAKINLPKIEQRAIERLGPYAKDAFELSTGKDLLQRYGKKEINELKDETIHSYLSKADRQISNRQNRMSQARERLNKNYEIYDVNNPTKIIDKFEANTPELARRYFEKFIKEYNPGDQNFEFEVRRSTGLSEEAVAEEVNPEVTRDSDEYFEPSQNVRMGDFVFNARTFTGALGEPNAKGLQIRAYDPKNLKRSIGSADFIVKTDKKGKQWLESDDTEVDDEYRGKGVATMMYAFAKSLGNDIKSSPYQSNAGKNMWGKWDSDADNLMREDYLPEK
jgi:predicted GNAT family acetyltransferase